MRPKSIESTCFKNFFFLIKDVKIVRGTRLNLVFLEVSGAKAFFSEQSKLIQVLKIDLDLY